MDGRRPRRRVCIYISLCFLIAAVITIVVLSAVYDHSMKLYIQDFKIPALKNPNATTLNTSIFIHLKFQRVMVLSSNIRFQDLNITLFYGFNRSFPVANHTLPGFNPGYKRRVHKKAVVEAGGLPWADAFQKVAGGSAVVLVVELAVKPVYEIFHREGECRWSEGEVGAVAAEVWVDGSGEKVFKNPIRLR